jgi:hypothetical protein
MPHGKPHRNPADVYTEGRLLAGESDPFNPAQPKKPKVKKPHPSCTTPEACVAQNRCRKTGKRLVNGKVAK